MAKTAVFSCVHGHTEADVQDFDRQVDARHSFLVAVRTKYSMQGLGEEVPKEFPGINDEVNAEVCDHGCTSHKLLS